MHWQISRELSMFYLSLSGAATREEVFYLSYLCTYANYMDVRSLSTGFSHKIF